MSIRIGDALIQRGLLTRQQLNHALQMQLIYGGHLGTCLIELGHLDEQELVSTLSELSGMKAAPPHAFEDIPAAVIRSLSPSLAKKHRVIPFGQEGRSLHVAAINRGAVGSLSSTTGLKIVPYIAAETQIVQALERYYSIQPRRRFIKVSYDPTLATCGLSRPEPGIPISVEPVPTEFDVMPESDPRVGDAGGMGDLEPVMALGALSRQMSRAMDFRQLADVILDYTARRTQRCILFDVHHGEAAVHSYRGTDLDDAAMSGMRLPLTPESIFALVLDDAHYRGPVPDDPECIAFFGELAIPIPREIILLPIYGDERLEAILYGDGGTQGCVAGPTESHLLLSENIALAMKMLAYKLQLYPG